MQIIDRIAEKISKDNMSVLKLSNETGISAYKIYKWLGKKGNPKHDDSVKLEQWLSESLEKVQMKPDIIGTSGNKVIVAEAKTDKDATIAALQYENMQLRLDKIEANLDEALSNQKVIMTMLTVAMTHAAEFFSGGSKPKADELKRKMMTDIASAQEKIF